MARVLALIPDLLFGSQVQGALKVAGIDVERASGEEAVRAAIGRADALVVDLTDSAAERAELVRTLAAEGVLDDVRTLAFYSHVENDIRVLAQDAGFDRVVPRSRMAREAAVLVEGLIGGKG